jgi:hypothetical protein
MSALGEAGQGSVVTRDRADAAPPLGSTGAARGILAGARFDAVRTKIRCGAGTTRAAHEKAPSRA